MSDSRALVQGALVGAMMKVQQDGGWLAVEKVEQPTDDDGAYLPFFEVYLRSGAVVRVAVSDDDDSNLIPEQEALLRDIEERLHRDFTKVLSEHGIVTVPENASLYDDLVAAAIHHVEKVVVP